MCWCCCCCLFLCFPLAVLFVLFCIFFILLCSFWDRRMNFNSGSTMCLCFALCSFAGIWLAVWILALGERCEMVFIAPSALTLGSRSQEGSLRVEPIPAGRVRTVFHVLDFIFVYTDYHLFFYHLVAGNLIICSYPSTAFNQHRIDVKAFPLTPPQLSLLSTSNKWSLSAFGHKLSS